VARRRYGFALLAAAVFVIAGCTQGSESGTPSPTTPTAEAEGEALGEVIAGDVAPLTGLPLGDDNLNRPSLAAKVDNHPAARPQVALDRADIVFEQLVEGGYTRFVAIWHSDLPPEIGPVRSVRPMDPDIVSPFGGILAYSGGQQRFIEAMLRAPVDSAIHGQSNVNEFFYRSQDKAPPYNVHVRAVDLVANFADKAPPKQQFSYAPDVASTTAVTAGSEVSSFTTRFSDIHYPTWEWSASDGVFQRSQSNNVADVALSGQRLQVENVVLLYVDIQVIQDIPTTILVTNGEGFVATGGHIVPVTWSKKSAEDVIELRDAGGQSVTLAPGKTWIGLIPLPDLKVPPGGAVTIN
jgi:hypothetical protein